MFTNIMRYLVFLAGLVATFTLAATDKAKEQRWADQIVDSLLDGEAVWLEAGDQRFLGIYTPDATGTPKGAVILLHGIGVHPNWPDVIYPLRTRLPEYGWSTMSIQLPVLPNDATLTDYAPLVPDAAPRIKATVAWLKKQGYKRVAVLGHSLGATMGAACLARDAPDGIMGLAIVGMGVNAIDPRMDNLAYLEAISVPVLDLYGSRDLDTVVDSAKERAKAARKGGNSSYRQTRIEGADHFFVGLEDDLVRTVRGWLDHTADSKSTE